MKDDYTTTRVWTKTIKILRMLHALTGESIVSILHRLAENELKRVQQEQSDDGTARAKHDQKSL